MGEENKSYEIIRKSDYFSGFDRKQPENASFYINPFVF